MNPGNKGANQAVAAARIDREITFIAKVGNDVFGKQAIELFKQQKINTEYIFIDVVNCCSTFPRHTLSSFAI